MEQDSPAYREHTETAVREQLAGPGLAMLPVHSNAVRQSSSCPAVREREV